MNPPSQQLSHQDTLDLMSADVSSVRTGGNQGGMMTTSSSTSSMGVLAAATMGSVGGYSQGSHSNGHAGGGQALNLDPPSALPHTNSLGGDIVSDNMWDFELTAADLFSFLQDS
jgi:hypothetical protein